MSLLSPNAAFTDSIVNDAESTVISTTETTTYSALSGAEEVVMLAFTVPAEPPTPPALIAQVSVQDAITAPYVKTITLCQDTGSLRPVSAMNSFSPIGDKFLQQIGAKHGFTVEELIPYHVTMVTPPKHGQARLVYEPSQHWTYAPAAGYTGADRAIYLVENQGKQYKVIVNFWVVEIIDENREVQECESINFGTSNGSSITAPGLTPISVSDFEAWQREAQLLSLINTVSNTNINFANLTAGAVGQATGTSITLDSNAAGHNWFIDTTPADNSEFLPTSNPYEWVAKEGSAAYGKMDMLSVLLHEYGHALGIDHSADGHDYMATTLTAGVRRLPSAEELALMQQLVGEVKVEMASVSTQGSGNTPSQLPLLPLGGFGLAFLGRLRGSRYGSLNVEADLSTLVTQFAVTANEKLTNGNFSVASGMPVDNGWATQGSVDFTPSAGSGQSGFKITGSKITGSGLSCGLAMSHNLAGVNPALVTASHGPSI